MVCAIMYLDTLPQVYELHHVYLRFLAPDIGDYGVSHQNDGKSKTTGDRLAVLPGVPASAWRCPLPPLETKRLGALPKDKTATHAAASSPDW